VRALDGHPGSISATPRCARPGQRFARFDRRTLRAHASRLCTACTLAVVLAFCAAHASANFTSSYGQARAAAGRKRGRRCSRRSTSNPTRRGTRSTASEQQGAVQTTRSYGEHRELRAECQQRVRSPRLSSAQNQATDVVTLDELKSLASEALGRAESSAAEAFVNGRYETVLTLLDSPQYPAHQRAVAVAHLLRAASRFVLYRRGGARTTPCATTPRPIFDRAGGSTALSCPLVAAGFQPAVRGRDARARGRNVRAATDRVGIVAWACPRSPYPNTPRNSGMV
jgi:hypothetical protein